MKAVRLGALRLLRLALCRARTAYISIIFFFRLCCLAPVFEADSSSVQERCWCSTSRLSIAAQRSSRPFFFGFESFPEASCDIVRKLSYDSASAVHTPTFL